MRRGGIAKERWRVVEWKQERTSMGSVINEKRLKFGWVTYRGKTVRRGRQRRGDGKERR